MKLGFYNDYVPGVVKGENIVDISSVIKDIPHISAQSWMAGLIENFDKYRAKIEAHVAKTEGTPLKQVKMRAPLPEPGRIVCMAGNFMENGTRKLVADRDAFLKSPSSVIGDKDTVVLPDCPAPHFHHEAETGVVISKTTKAVSPDKAMDHVFGFVNFMDVSARGIKPNDNNSFFWGKSWDTFGPMGPFIVTKDEAGDPQKFDVLLTVNKEVRQKLNNSDMGRPVPEVVEFASWVTTLKAGDLVSCGTNHVGLSNIQDGDVIEMEITGLGKLTVNVKDEWKRTWPRKTLAQMTAFESTVRSKIAKK